MVWRRLGFVVAFSGACAVASAQAPVYNLGKAATPQDVKTFDHWSPITNDGKGLPAGSGTSEVGEKIFAQKCQACHGANGKGGGAPQVIYDKTPAATGHRQHIFPQNIAYAPILWDYIYRAMPMLTGPGTLKPDEVYSLTAYLLAKNDVIGEKEVMDAQTLSKVKMPLRGEVELPSNIKAVTK